MSIKINNLVNKPVDTVYLTHGHAKQRSILDKILNGADTVIIVGSHDKLIGGYANFKNQTNIKLNKTKSSRRNNRHRRGKLAKILK